MNKNKAFTMVEIIIVFVLMGLLAAMAIPAFQKVKISTIGTAAISGTTLTSEQEEYLREHFDQLHDSIKGKLNRDTLKPIQNYMTVPDSNNIVPVKVEKVITIDGKTYYLIPKN